MELATFFEKFDQFADAPNAVAKMRELVLHLAVTGRLVATAQDWQMKPLKSLASKIGSGATPAGGRESYFSEGIPLIRSMNVHFRGFDRTGIVFLSEEQAAKLANVAVQPDDVLLNITGASIGRVTTAPPEMAGARVNQHVTIIRPTDEMLPRFLTMFLASPEVQRMIDEVQVGATRQALTKAMIEQFIIPLPPLAGQKRIVTKVDELMALCDRLEAQQQERNTRHAALARAALARFADAPTPANLNLLFHSSCAIAPADIRKTILTLAVQGKLVEQKRADGATTELLAVISRERASCDRKARIPDDQPLANGVDHLFQIPSNWAWIKLGNVALQIQYGYTASADSSLTDVRMLRITDIQNNRVDWPSVPGCQIEINDVEKYLLSTNDILIARTGGTIGKSFIVSETPVKSVFASYLIRVTPPQSIEARYLKIFLESPLYWMQLRVMSAGTGQPNVNGQALGRLEIPLPPLAEQRRIVAKVDQLMALVDRLETQLAASRAASINLMEAVVGELTVEGP